MLMDSVKTRAGQPMPDSLYARQGQDCRQPRDPLTGALSCAVAIVGAGYTGLSTALHLAKRGMDCVVLEANEPGWGASGRNGGQVNPGLKHPPDQVAADIGPDAVRFSYAAADRVFDLVRDHQIDCEIRRGGTIRAAIDAATTKQLQDLAQQCGRHGLAVEVLSAEDMSFVTGTRRYPGGLFDPAGGQLNPLKFVRGLAAAVRAHSVRICTDTPVTRAAKRDGRWQLTTPEGEVAAEKVLFATNGYSGPVIPKLRRSLLPVFSSIIASEPLPETLAKRILTGGQSLFEVGPVTTYYRVDAQRRLIFGGRGQMSEMSGPGAFPSLARYAAKLWPDLDHVTWEFGWNGRVALTSDHYPHLHVIEDTGLVCVGFNGRGVAIATAMGEELAAMLAEGAQHQPVFPVTPIKAIPFQLFWPAAVGPALLWARLRNTVQAQFSDDRRRR